MILLISLLYVLRRLGGATPNFLTGNVNITSYQPFCIQSVDVLIQDRRRR
jgi:hypothetical protein